MMLVLFLCSSLCSAWNWREGFPGECLRADLESFDTTNFEGHYYNLVRTYTTPMAFGDCIEMDIIRIDDSSFNVIESMKVDGEYYYVENVRTFDTKNLKLGEAITQSPHIINTAVYYSTNILVTYLCEEIGANKRHLMNFWSKDINFDPSPYFYLAYDRGFSKDELHVVNHDPNFCA